MVKKAEAAQWQQGNKVGALKMTMGVVCDPPRPGLVVEIYMNRGHKVLRRTLNFGLWDTASGVWERAYQLTVADSNSPTHTENGVTWFGSHDHIGEIATQKSHLDTIDFHEALQLFCRATSLTIDDGPIADPTVFVLT